MLKNIAFPIARRLDGARSAWPLGLRLVALVVALAGGPVLADQDYPPGLFENSPVVPPGQQYAVPHPGPAGPDATPGYGRPPGPDDPMAPVGPEAAAPPPGYCAGIANRTFGSIEEVRRAHAQCDRFRGGPPPPPPGY
jgi:hypothetical protein